MEQTNMSDVVSEIKGATEEDLKNVIKKHFEAVRTQGMKIGAFYISAAVSNAITKNIKTGSLRDHQRAIKSIMDIVSVQLQQQETVQNDLDTEEISNDGTAE